MKTNYSVYKTQLRGIGLTLHNSCKNIEWWTIPNESVLNKLYSFRDGSGIPFTSLVAGIGAGKFIVYKDLPIV